jgi:segregation and condensation protein B
MAINEIKKQVEALLFSCGRKMELEEIGKLIGVNSEKLVSDTLNQLKNEYIDRDSPIMLIDEGSAWKLAVREPFLPLVRKINPYTEFPKSVMETLAVVAWKQPILQSTVIKFRTNKAYDHIDQLIDMGFIVKEKYGRTSMLKLTQKFYDYFDLQDRERVKDLFKRFKDEDKLEQKRVEDFEKQKELDEPIPNYGKNDRFSVLPHPGIGREIAVKAEEKGETIEEEILDEIIDAEDKDDIEKEDEIISELGKIEMENKVDSTVKSKEEVIFTPAAQIMPLNQEQKKESLKLDEPLPKSSDQLPKPAFKQPAKQAINLIIKPTAELTTKLIKKPVEKTTLKDKSAANPPLRPTIKPIEKSVEKPAAKPIAKSVVKTSISEKIPTKLPAKGKQIIKKRK